MYPTVADVLAIPVVQRGTPAVVAGSAGLHRRVRWVHAAEVAEIAHLLSGGELVLTTGIAGQRPLPGTTVAASLCGAMESLTRALALELAPLRTVTVRDGDR